MGVKIWNMRMDPETLSKLEKLAKSTERSASGMVRWLIHREYDARYSLTADGQQVLEERRKSSTTE